MMWDVAFHMDPTKADIEDMRVETVAGGTDGMRNRHIIRVTSHLSILADAYADGVSPEDEQTLLDLVRVRGMP